MTKLETLRKEYRVAKSDYDKVMHGGFDDEVCRAYACMMTDAKTKLDRHLERMATSGGK